MFASAGQDEGTEDACEARHDAEGHAYHLTSVQDLGHKDSSNGVKDSVLLRFAAGSLTGDWCYCSA